MSVPAIALYASPPSGICSTSHHPHGSAEYDPNARSSSTSAKPVVGGLSCLFSSPSVLHASSSVSFPAGDDIRAEEISCSYSYSNVKGREQSPVSVFQGPGSYSRSPSSLLKTPREFDDFTAGRDRLFKGFVTNALGSCLDYDIPSLSVSENEFMTIPEELTFDMEDAAAEAESCECEPYAKEMLSDAQSRHKIFHQDFVVKAFFEAEKAHKGQIRANGDPYLRHCLETALLLANVGANATVVAAGLLHDTFDDSFMSYDDIARSFGAGVADLVAMVSKISQISKFARESDTADKSNEAVKLHTMILAMTDARAVLIKLADRLHNMTTLDALPLAKQRRFSKETLEIFAPLANRLGIFSWKEQLENLCFKHLNPEEYSELSSKLLETFDEAMIESAKEKLERALNIEGVLYHVLHGRHKSLYSIYSKMSKKNLSMNEIHDIHGLRLIVENESDCYKALDVVHRLWSKVEGRFKDYIVEPKFNGYQSLHTVVLGGNMVPLEVQIRTKEMHLQAEFGIAAHWRYKERDHCKHSSFVLQMIEWARWVLTWHCETMRNDHDTDSVRPPCSFPFHSDECPFYYKPQGNHDGPVYIVLLENDKMSVKELPAGSSLKDLFDRVDYRSPQSIAFNFSTTEEPRPKLNNTSVTDPCQKLQMGDVVELAPAIPNKSLTECREEMQRMYDHSLAISIKRR